MDLLPDALLLRVFEMLDIDTLIKHCELVDKRFLSTVRRLIGKDMCDQWLSKQDLHIMSLVNMLHTAEERKQVLTKSLFTPLSITYMESRMFKKIFLRLHSQVRYFNSRLVIPRNVVLEYLRDLCVNEVLRSTVLGMISLLNTEDENENIYFKDKRKIDYNQFVGICKRVMVQHLRNVCGLKDKGIDVNEPLPQLIFGC